MANTSIFGSHTRFSVSAYKYLIGLIVGFLLLPLSGTLHAQRSIPKYENLYKQAMLLPPTQAYNVYMDYLSMAPAPPRANLYFQLAELSSKILQDIDPILQYDDFSLFARETKTHTNLALQYLTDAETKRDRDLFVGVPSTERRIGTQDIRNYLLKKALTDSSYISENEDIHRAFTGMLKAYSESANGFRSINERYSQQEELYSSWNDQLETDLKSIVMQFDSVRHYVEWYREALVKRPTKNYLVNYSFSKIEGFRNTGFSPVDFTDPHAALWDYGGWAADILKHFNNNIKPLLQHAKELDATLAKQISSGATTALDFNDQSRLLMDLRRVDPNSVLEAELQRKLAQLRLLATINDLGSADLKGKTANELVGLYINMQDRHGQLAAATLELQRRSGTAPRYKALLDTSKDALDNTDVRYQHALKALNEHWLREENTSRQSAFLEYKKQEVPFFLGNGFYRASSAGYVTKCIMPGRDGGFFISGSSINAQGFAVAFVAYSANGQTINWMKIVDVEKVMYDDCAMSMTLGPNGGCFALISSKSVSDPSLTSQTIVWYDLKGDEKLRLTLPEKTLPLGRSIWYNPAKNSFILAFYGESENDFEPNGKLVVQQVGMDNTQIFRTGVQLNGSLLTLIPLEESNRYMLVGNYNSIEAGATQIDDLKNGAAPNEEFKLPEGVSGAYTILIDNAGTIVKTNTYPQPTSYYIAKAIRTDGEILLLIGEQGTIRGNTAMPYSNSGKPVFIVTE